MTKELTDLDVEYLNPSNLKPYKNNARTHSNKQIRQIADSIRTFGFTNPILIDQQHMILAGHGRLKAAQQLGLETVPCVRLDHMSDPQKRAYILADNKLALNAGWDEELLAEELSELYNLDIDFDVEITGFSIPEIDHLLEQPSPQEPHDPRDDAVIQRPPARVRTGDLWQLGPHRLICGNALDPQTLSDLMGEDRARMVFTDPPYNVPIKGHVGGSGRTQHREFAMASGEMSAEDFISFLATAFQNMADVSRDGSIHFICMDWRHLKEIQTAGEAVYHELKNLITWVKDNGGMGTFYRSRHELIFAYKYGKADHLNNFELGQHGRYRTNVWQYKGVNTFKTDRMDELGIHPTVKPVQMIADAIRDVSGRGDIVLDPFGGSGSTLIAAHKAGRHARLVELDPLYCDQIIARYERYAHDDAELLKGGHQ